MPGIEIEYVAVKKPRGVLQKRRKDGTVVIRIEMTQEKLNETISKAFKKYQEGKEG